jgi:hypothetical protein
MWSWLMDVPKSDNQVVQDVRSILAFGRKTNQADYPLHVGREVVSISDPHCLG